MKLRVYAVIAALVICAALQGCGSKAKDTESAGSSEAAAARESGDKTEEETAAGSTAAAGTAAEIESTVPDSSAETESPTAAENTAAEKRVTAETAYEGVSRYCQIELGIQPESGGTTVMGLEMGEETASEYQLIFRSYTGAFVYFHVDKESGSTRTEEYVPALDARNDTGTFDLFEYLGKEIPEEPSIDTTSDTASDTPQTEKYYLFQPKVCSVYMEEVFGKTMCETWYALVDAVMAGENTFACPDQETYNWVMGQFPERCFPVLIEVIDYAYDRENSVVDGVASFTWKIPYDEAAARIAAFAEQVEGILNDALEPGYSDLEKILALYIYFSDHYEYDYEMYDRQMVDPFAEINSLRFFRTGAGICHEIATAYSYLLMQVGVEATTMGGNRASDNMSHLWSYVRIGGRDFHVDPTYVVSDKGLLSYFMMTDEQRTAMDNYMQPTFTITSHYSQDHPHPDYAANDAAFAPVWDYAYDSFDPETDKLYGYRYDDNGVRSDLEFDYAGY